jgi:hypothetical protein
MLTHALKEWAVICEALARGQQSLLLRKGGIAETEGTFDIEQQCFWLYPTYVHQQSVGIQEEARPLLDHVKANRPPAGTLRLQYWAEVGTVYRLRAELSAHVLSHLHIWSEETVRSRFHYREPGLYVMMVRVYRASTVHEIDESPEYAGCRSWVELAQALPTDDSTPVLDDASYHIVTKQVDLLLKPTALA